MFASLEDAAVMLFGQSRTPYLQNNTLLQPYRFFNAFQILDALQEAGLALSYQQYSPQWMNSLETDQVFFYPCSLWLMSMGIFHTGQSWGFTGRPAAVMPGAARSGRSPRPAAMPKLPELYSGCAAFAFRCGLCEESWHRHAHQLQSGLC